MSDYEALQGYWRLVSITLGGRPVGTSASHWHFQGSLVREISPNWVDTGNVTTDFELDEEFDPKTICLHHRQVVAGHPVGEPFLTRCGVYRLDGDSLQIRFGGIAGRFPASFDDENGTLHTFARHYGPPPQGKQPSGTPPIHDDFLGMLTWDDNLQRYSGKFTDDVGTIDIAINPLSLERASEMLERCRGVLSQLNRYRDAAADYAAKQLLSLKNEVWLDEDEAELTPNEFRQRMRLEAITFDSGGSVTFYHNDGDLFWGHCIQIGMDRSG
jgi:uncharacterized protein (TIGR03067 family)